MATNARIISNRKNLSATVHFVANGTIKIAGNNSVSDIALPGETIAGATITQVWHGSDMVWNVKRGANIVAVFDSTASFDFAGTGNSLNLDMDQDLTVELLGTANGFIMIELQKFGVGNNGSLISPLSANSEYFQP